VSMATIDDKVYRILRSMFALQLFEHPVQLTPLPEQEHGQLAREIAGKGIVLLKNASGLLPLSSHELRSLAVIGGDADHYITGSGSSFVKPTYVVSMLEGIRRRVGEGVRVEYAEGIDPITPADLLPGPPLVPSSVLTPVGSDPHVRDCRRSTGQTRALRANRNWSAPIDR
jgi:beta-glucosidase